MNENEQEDERVTRKKKIGCQATRNRKEENEKNKRKGRKGRKGDRING